MNEDTGKSWVETISSSPGNVLPLLILQKREELIQEFRNYYYREARGVEGKLHKVKARLLALFMEISRSLERSYTPEEYQELRNKVYGEDFDSMEKAYYQLNEFLDSKRITRFDTRTKIDTTRVEVENNEKNI